MKRWPCLMYLMRTTDCRRAQFLMKGGVFEGVSRCFPDLGACLYIPGVNYSYSCRRGHCSGTGQRDWQTCRTRLYHDDVGGCGTPNSTALQSIGSLLDCGFLFLFFFPLFFFFPSRCYLDQMTC